MKTPSFLHLTPAPLLWRGVKWTGALMVLLFSSQMAFSQSGVKWSVHGNVGDSTTFVGTTNAFPLLFKVDNTKWMSLSTTGQLQLEALQASGTGFAWFDSNGNLMRTNFPNDTNQVLTGNGTFHNIANLGGWKIVGNDMFNVNYGFVGIGTSNPSFPLDVSGNMRVNGIIYAQGVVLATKVEADTMKSTSMISVNNNLSFYSGLVNDIYTSSGDVRLQSRIGFGGNTILNAGNNGNVGIGIYSPQFKLDVNGNVRVNGSITATGLNILQLNADSMKSTSMISVNNNLKLTGGYYSDIYTQTGEVRLQSRNGSNGNTILNAGTNGNVGVGTYNPMTKLDVNGDAMVSGKIYANRIVPLPGDSVIRFGDSTLYYAPWRNLIFSSPNSQRKGIGIGFGSYIGPNIYMYNTDPMGLHSVAIGYNVATAVGAEQSVVLGSGGIGGPIFTNSIPFSIMLGSKSDKPTLFVGPASGVGTTGQVGIGTTNPQGDFQVGDGFFSASMGGTNGSSTYPPWSSSYFGLNVAYKGLDNWLVQGNGTSNGGVVMLGTVNGSFDIVTIPSIIGGANQTLTDANIVQNTRFQIRPDGKVVIGDGLSLVNLYTPGNYRLYVEDGIMTEKLKVWSVGSWADYVFDSSYVLTPLDTVADFIQKNHHLSGIPDAADVKKNGIDVAETDAALLAKIEELYLYTIQLEKKNADLEKRIEAVEKNKGAKRWNWRRKRN